jgi:hypothetical protein
MSNKQKVKPVDRATPTIRKPKGTDPTKVSVTRSTTTAMQASPSWNQAPAVQTASKAWNSAADAIEGNAKVVADLRSKLAAAEAAQRGLRRDWNDALKQMLATVAIFCQGSADQVHAFGFDVLTHAGLGLLATPGNLATKPGTVIGEAVFSWARGSARHGFLVQHATDVNNAQTVSAAVPCTRSKYTLTGAPTSSVVHFRVAAIDPAAPTGQTPWSDWVAGTVR